MYFYFACIALWMRFTAHAFLDFVDPRGDGSRLSRVRPCARPHGAGRGRGLRGACGSDRSRSIATVR